MVEAIHRFRNESRTIDYVILPPSLVGAAATPSDEELKKYFDEREQTFRAKEYRKLTTLVVSPSTRRQAGERVLPSRCASFMTR